MKAKAKTEATIFGQIQAAGSPDELQNAHKSAASAESSAESSAKSSVQSSVQSSAESSEEDYKELILYDGVCGLCNRFIKTVVDHDPGARFQFASLQSELGQSILTTKGKDPSALKSVYLVKGFGTDNVTLLAKAEAAVDIFGQLDGPIRYLKLLSILPVWLLNLGYDLIAANRYRFFGRLDACPLPDPAHLKRFLDQ